eukprot:CAMPEP_0178906722 /NCGR_PEP_ID=MMETSP0786-20121207/6979_1 /TAXON_ID=186022 /ORGANISM="Thalassionema frauenfeldii, Strain CCMP 1798" /LENGTH=626 /DNA_ID=CAMNT_0020578453 /DNA_START=38 /DNA_END=1915 /DNA_ORIENTATION=+
MAYPIKKGDIIDSFKPWMIVPLVDSSINLPNDLPRVGEIEEKFIFKHCIWNKVPAVKSSSMSELNIFLTSALQKDTIESYTVFTALAMANNSNHESEISKLEEITNKQQLNLTEEEEELITEAWIVLKNSSWSWLQWLGLYSLVRTQIYLTSVQHPLASYAKTVLPKLSPGELKKVHEVMHAAGDFRIHENCEDQHLFLYLSQAIQDGIEPIPIGFLPKNPLIEKQWMTSHLSCLPNIALDWNSEEQKLQTVALYDLLKEEELQISRVTEAETLQERQILFERKFHKACDCIRCNCEKDGVIPINKHILVRMGHLAFRESRFRDALTFYRSIAQQENNSETLSAWHDSWHAIGAVLLAQKKFVEAQQHWQEAVIEHPELMKHPGIAEEIAKQKAYGFSLNDGHNGKNALCSDSQDNIGNQRLLPGYTSYFDKLCFVTTDKVVSQKTCQWIISLVEEKSNWTTNRHYAVPTNDVPVHHISSVLSWFNKWMVSTVRPLLEDQFNLEGDKFFVHDAFVVRYQASKSSKFLPIHVDESTHSFVLTLNSDFEGGGTYFFDHQETLCPKRPGSLITFKGESLKHGGNAITKGVRYILAAFLYHDALQTQQQRGRKRSLSSIKKKKEHFSFAF